MRRYSQRFIFLIVGMIMLGLSGCATCHTNYRRELTDDVRLRPADISYRKAVDWIEKGDCAETAPKAEEAYVTADSYLVDAVFKLKQLGHDNKIDTSEDIYYCEKVRREIAVSEGAARKHTQVP